MKKIFTFLTVACMVFTGCTEEDTFGGKYSAANVGDEITFGGAMDYKSNDNDKKRTVYGQKHDGITDIKWYEGDMVRIYCEQTMDANLETGSRNFCDYEVTGDNVIGTTEDPTAEILTDGLHEVTLKNASDIENGLRWGTTNPHRFYGVYPSPKMLSKYADDNLAANALKIENNKVSAYLPNLQRPGRFVDPVNFSNNGATKKLHVIHPSMRHAYMVAYDEASPADGGVDLTFKPIVTAVEMVLENMGESAINGITMVSLTSEQAICGNFTTTIEGTPVITNIDTDESVKSVSVPTAADGKSIDLNPGDRIKFTVFMTLNVDINKLGVTIVYSDGIAKKKATLQGNNGVNLVQAKKKNFISTVAVNFATVVQSIDIANWMAALPDDTPIEGLSIPGAGGATSGTKTGDNYNMSDGTSRQQDLNITELWNNGIRCFEFFTDKASSTSKFGTQNITCNGISTGVSVDKAVDEIATLVINYPKEFAVVIIGYEEPYTSAANGEYARSAGNNGYGDNFNNWWSAYPHITRNSSVYQNRSKFNKDKILPECSTLSEARGRLFCIGRPVSLGIDPGWYTGIYSDNGSSDLNCLYILGWGNNPDQWYARGYGNMVVQNYVNTSTNGIPAGLNTDDRPYKIGTSKQTADATYNKKSTVSYYTDSNKGTNNTLSKYVYKATQKTHVNYMSSEYDVMVQEWRRVMPTAEIQAQYGIASPEGKGFFGFHNNETEYFSAWSPSTDEKWSDVVSTFEAATNKTGNYDLYINSLCGYFIDGSIALSYQPRPTFQRYFNKDSYYGVYLDDKYRHDDFTTMDQIDNPASSGNNTAPKTSTRVNWGPYTPAGGYQGNIAAYADWINNKFYNYLLGTTINGSTGIIMMDRISDDAKNNPAGYYIPRIILANNPFPENSNIQDNKSVTIQKDENGVKNDDKFAAPAKRNATNDDNVSIVWE